MNRFRQFWRNLWTSFWFVQSLIVMTSIAFATVLIEADSAVIDSWPTRSPRLFGAGPERARDDIHDRRLHETSGGIEGIMLKHKLLSPEGILILEPSAPLEAADFADLAREIDPYLVKHGTLSGVLIFAKAFPGWLNLEAAIAHLQLVERYHRKIKRLAIVSDNGLLTALPNFAAHLVHPEVKHFSESAYDDALRWLREAASPANLLESDQIS
jgi:hypothetical protein